MDERGKKSRAKGLWLVAVLVVSVLTTAALGADRAAAEILVDQPPGPSGVGVLSDGPAEWENAYDDFAVPVGGHWHLEGIQVFGKAEHEHPRTFKVDIVWGAGTSWPVPAFPQDRIFTERVTVAGGPNYLIPIVGAPPLDHRSAFESGQIWISVQAVSSGGEDDWYWLTGPGTPGTVPAYVPRSSSEAPGAEPGLAFQLLGTATQTVKASVSGAGTITSNPPGIACPGTCAAEFPRGTAVTFTSSPLKTSVRFTEWGFRNTGFMGPPGALVPIQVPSPCGGTGGCAFTLEQDTNVGAVFEPIDEATVLRVARDRRTGKGHLLVWAPGEGVLSLKSSGLRSFFPRWVPAGLVRIPLLPRRRVADTLRHRGRATVSARIEFRARGVDYPGTTQVPLTLVEKRPGAHRAASVTERSDVPRAASSCARARSGRRWRPRRPRSRSA